MVSSSAVTATAALAIYGQQPQPEETPDFLSASHAKLTAALEKLPAETTAGWSRARERCPELVGDAHRLMFLRCEVFDAELAALRLGKYWNRRLELFGDAHAFLPLRLGANGALDDVPDSDGAAGRGGDKALVRHTHQGLRLGFIRSMGTHDTGGRAILFADPSRLKGYDKNNLDERMGVARALWYVMHSVLDGNDAVQKLGVVVIAFPRNAKLSSLDRTLMKMNMEAMSGCLPVRVGGFHVCHPPWFFGKVVFPLMKVLMPERMRRRVRVHSGSEEKVLESLEQFGLSPAALPREIRGGLVWEDGGWKLG